MTEPTLLDECAISKIEARIAKRDDTSALESACGEYNCSCHYDLPALCATVKHLREDAKLVDEYIAEVKRELGMQPNSHLSITLERYKEKVQSEVRAEMQSQLEQLRAENQRLTERLTEEVEKRVAEHIEKMNQAPIPPRTWPKPWWG